VLPVEAVVSVAAAVESVLVEEEELLLQAANVSVQAIIVKLISFMLNNFFKMDC
jgi:hypothetical protein